MAGQVPNVCAGPFGAFYDFYIERPRLMQANWLAEAGLGEVQLGPEAGFTSFEARRPPARHR